MNKYLFLSLSLVPLLCTAMKQPLKPLPLVKGSNKRERAVNEARGIYNKNLEHALKKNDTNQIKRLKNIRRTVLNVTDERHAFTPGIVNWAIRYVPGHPDNPLGIYNAPSSDSD